MALGVILATGCRDRPSALSEPDGGALGPGGAGGAAPSPSAESPPPGTAPSGSGVTDAPAPSASAARIAPLACPDDMLAIPGDDGVARYCIDRYEASLVDAATKQPLSPYYPPHPKLARQLNERWQRERETVGGPQARAMALPPLPASLLGGDIEFLAVSRPGVVPSGYLTGHDAARACKNAGKRLCRHDEWLRACKGERQRPFPYGDTYRQGACNIFRPKHPAAELHDDPSVGHLDPRLNLVTDGGDPLLRKTGATKSCASEWGDRALFDMNGNLDEWVDDDKGRFVGGFYSRSKRDGCLSSVGSHPRAYFDYSTGTRCCLSPDP